MRKSILKIIFVTALLIFTAISPATAALRAEPITRSPFGQVDRFETDLFTGGAVYSYSINVPKSTNGLTPEISLSYNSHGAKEFSMYTGAGWQLSQDYIERDSNFTPTNTADDKFRLRFKGGSYELVYVASENRYHTKTESFLNIQKLSGGQNDRGDYWQVITQDGTKHRFGYQGQSELMCNGRDYISRWFVDEVTDTHNNHIFYTYFDSAGTAYPLKIEYNNDKQRVIDFAYIANPSARSVYQQGCSVSESSQLKDINIKANGSIVRTYILSYNATATGQQLLSSITEKGNNGSLLPATSFTYKPEIRNWHFQNEQWFVKETLDAHLDMKSVALTDVNGDGLADIVKSAADGPWKVLLNHGNGWPTTYQTWVNGIDARLEWDDVRLVDVTGDNLPDIVKEDNPVIKVWRHTGSGWSTTPESWANGGKPSFNDLSKGFAIVDLNGDNFAELLMTSSNGSQSIWEVWGNAGSGWGDKEVWWGNVAVYASLNQPNVRLADVNGDGLPDIVKTTNSGSTATWLVYKNTGTTWSTSPETWINNANVDAYLGKPDVVLSDADGDGLTDIVKTDDNNSIVTWKILRNTGAGWATTWEIWIDPSTPVDADAQSKHTRIADVTGEGLPDIVRGTPSCSTCGTEVTWQVFKNKGKASNLLNTVKTAQGATISFDYKASTTLDNTGADDRPDLPYNLWVIEKKTENNGMTNSQQTNDITTYNYKDGLYKWQEREFRGFGAVDENLAGANNKKYVFHQDDALKGMLAELQTRDTLGNPFAETENTWSSSQINGVTSVKLSQEKNYTYDGTAANPKITQTDYEYDTFGNVTKKSERGDTAVTGDERFSYFEYTINPNLWITNTPKHTFMRDANDFTKVSERWFYYDAHPGLDDQPTKGDVTKEVKWLEGGTNPVTLYEYNGFGNQTKVINATNHATTATYDVTGTYPATTTNAKNQTTTTTYDLGTGNLLAKADPNNFITSYEYDVFGRVKKEIKPYDSSTNPTTSYTYLFDGIAPEGILVSKRETSGATATLDTMSFVDGFGRDMQTRGEAEDTTKDIVTNTYYNSLGEVSKKTVPYLAAATATNAPVTTTVAKTTAVSIPVDGWTLLDSMSITENFAASTAKVEFSASVTNTAPNTTVYIHIKLDGVDKDYMSLTTGSTGATQTLTSASNIAVTAGQHTISAWIWTNSGTVSAGNRTITAHYTPATGTIYAAYGTPDANARFTESAYDPLGRMTSLKNTKGDVKTTAYDHWKETHTDEKGHIKREYLNAYGKISKVEEVNGATTYATTYEYNKRDELTKITDTQGNVNTLTYDTLGRRKSQTDPDMGTWLYEYDAVDNLTKKTDQRGIATTFTSDALGRRTGINYPTKTDVTYVYDGNSKIGTLTSVTDETGTIAYTYDNRLRKTQEQRVLDGLTWTTQFAYDALDRVISRTNPGSTPITYTHNAQGEVNSLTGFVTNIDYNALSKVTKKVFANSLTTNYTYNTDDFRLNRIQTGTLFDSGYTYDKVGNILSITDNLLTKTQTFGYDDLDRLTTAQETGGYTHAYEYNAIGNLTKLTDAGNAINYTYGQNAGAHALTSSSETAPTPTPVTSGETELLGTTWTLSGNNGSDEEFKGIPADSLVGKQSVKVTFDLHGSSFGGGDDEASVIFVQNGDWRAANLIAAGAQNGLNGVQTVTIPIASFHKIGNAGVTLDPTQPVSDLRARFWKGSAFTVDMTSIKAVGAGGSNPTATPTPTNTPTPTPTPGSGNYVFTKGINFNGTAVTIEGNAWQSMTTAQSNGLSIPAYTAATTSLTPNPAVNADTNAMLNSGIWKSGSPLAINQTLSNGTYQVYVWIMENYQNNVRKMDVKLEGSVAATGIGQLAKNSWVKYGPYTVTVSDGTLNLELVNVLDNPHIQGMAIFKQDGSQPPAPTATPTPTNTPTPTPTPNQSGWTEILGTTWNLAGSNGSAEKDKGIAANTLNGKTSVQVTFNLNGKSFGSGDDEASIIFIQNGDWRVANLIAAGAQNGLTGSQTVTIPITSFHKVGNAGVVLDPNQAVSNLHARFWHSSTYSVDITSVKVQ